MIRFPRLFRRCRACRDTGVRTLRIQRPGAAQPTTRNVPCWRAIHQEA